MKQGNILRPDFAANADALSARSFPTDLTWKPRALTQNELRCHTQGYAEGIEAGKWAVYPLYIAGIMLGMVGGLVTGMVMGAVMAQAATPEPPRGSEAWFAWLDAQSVVIDEVEPINQREEMWIECTDTPQRVGAVVFNVVQYLPKMPHPKLANLHCTERRGILDDTILGTRP